MGEQVRYGQTEDEPAIIGYLPDVPEFYGFMRPMEYLRLCGEIAGMAKGDIAEKSEGNCCHGGAFRFARKRSVAFPRA